MPFRSGQKEKRYLFSLLFLSNSSIHWNALSALVFKALNINLILNRMTAPKVKIVKKRTMKFVRHQSDRYGGTVKVS